MIELQRDRLVFSFPEVHDDARCTVAFQRTLRIPDDEREYPLPPGLGRFPLRHVDDFARRLPAAWIRRGGVMLPMYQSEALWLNFGGRYPVAIKVAAGKVNAVTGEDWSEPLSHDPQDYAVIPEQPWLDGYCVETGVVRQFVALPLGSGYTAEEQLRGAGEHGGIQLIAYPMKREAYERLRPPAGTAMLEDVFYCASGAVTGAPDMGLAPGGRMRQEIYDDPYDPADWDSRHARRCFVHLANSIVWRAITGEAPPTVPPTAEEYERHGLPWFDYYSDAKALEGSDLLARLKSVAALGKEEGDAPLPENEPVEPGRVVRLRKGLAPGQVREGRF